MRLIVASVAACVLASAIAVGATAAHRFAPTDPLTGSQWYLTRTKALDGWDLLPDLQPVRVAVVDSGLDLGHPEFAGRIVAARSFVGGSAQDVRGHGTVVAGIIAAGVDNGVGIAGLAPSAELLVAKVVGNNGSISVKAEARAIRWAVDNGARVINMSLGGLRDPRELARDTYSRTEADAIRYAVAHDVLVVAAVGNGDAAPHEPWPFASYPAALPHVLGVSAIARSGTSPGFSNRDPLYNDLAAPGEEVASTFPRALTDARQGCAEQGYTQCATDEFQSPEGTSFAAPQVSAVAANLLAVDPKLSADQVATILTRTADDASAASGCTICPLGRDAFTGWGELDGMAALAALAGPLPPADRFEPNDDVGAAAYRLYLAGGEAGSHGEGNRRLLGRPGRPVRDLPPTRRAGVRVAQGLERRRPRACGVAARCTIGGRPRPPGPAGRALEQTRSCRAALVHGTGARMALPPGTPDRAGRPGRLHAVGRTGWRSAGTHRQAVDQGLPRAPIRAGPGPPRASSSYRRGMALNGTSQRIERRASGLLDVIVNVVVGLCAIRLYR